jgi:drug/metabolite transporter (DMT)-like permease
MTVRSGVVLVVVGALLLGMLGVLVRGATMPLSLLLVLRMGVAGVLVAVFFARRAVLDDLRRPGVWRLVLLIGVVDAGSLLCTFVAIRYTNVAVALFLSFMAPVYVAVLAPRVFRERTEKVVFGALLLALAGMALMLSPGLRGGGELTVTGVSAGVAAGLLLGIYFLIAKALRSRVGSPTIVLGECFLTAAFVLPLALWQTGSSGYHLSGDDALRVLALAVLCTAIPYMLIVTSLRYVRVQHVSILGYLEPVSAPVYALILLGEVPSAWTVAGGTLILAAGVLVVVRGRAEAELLT